MTRYKYVALRRYLAEQASGRVTLSLAEIETIIGAPLPPRVQQASFWASTRGGDGPAWAWRSVGWCVDERRYQHPTWLITFARDETRPAGPL